MRTIRNPELLCPIQTAGGIRRIWFNSRSRFGQFWYYTETHTLQYGTITGHSGDYNLWYKLNMRLTDASFSFDQENDTNRLYPIGLKINFNQMDIPRRDMIEQMVVAQDAVFIVEDRNGTYWLIGETLGCQIDWQGGTGERSGLNSYSITATARERYPVRTVAQSYIDTYVDPATPILNLCGYEINDLCNLTIQQFCEIPIN